MRFHKPMILVFACIAFVMYLSMRLYSTEEVTTSVISTQHASNIMQVYLKDQSNTLVPLSIPVSEEESEEDKLKLMFAYLSGKQTLEGFYPLFQKECFLNDVKMEDGVARLYFDASLKNYKKEDELRVLEAITWGATQFSSVEKVELYLNEQRMKEMPLGQTPIPEILNRDIGINHFETATDSLHDSFSLTVFSTKKIGSKEYLVPKSRRCRLDKQDVASQVAVILEDISVSSGLSSKLHTDRIEIKNMNMKDGLLKVELNDHILASDASVKQNAYDTFVLSLASIPMIERVEIRVGKQIIHPTKEESTSVSLVEMTYNEVEF